jgi:RNA polymerase sigma-70 factor (ECF subfamily)
MEEPRTLADRFETQRAHLRAIAYRMLGSEGEADDAVQEAWLRLSRADAGAVDNLGGWLTTVVARICLDQLRARKGRRETPLAGEPEVATTADAFRPDAELQLADSVGVALLVVLETLSPAERLAFVLHDVFGLPFEEVAVALDRSPDAARQLASRARRRLRDAPPVRPARREQRAVLDAWLRAVQDGDLAALLALLDDGAVLHADYGRGRLQTIAGAAAIAEQATLAARLAQSSVPVLIDGRPGVAAVLDGRVVSVMAFDIAGGRIVGLDVLFDPARLAHTRL